MATVKRILAIVAIILSVLVLLISIGGIVGGWAVGGALKDVSTKVLSGVERALDVTDDGLGRVDERLGEARANLNTIEEAVTDIGSNVEETDFALLFIERTVGEELAPKVEAIRETVSTIRASAIAFNDTLEAANEIPFVDVPTLTDELERASERTAEARTAMDELRTSVAVAKSEAVQGAVSAITERTGRIDGALEELQGDVADYQAKINTTEDKVASLKSRIRLWIDVATIIIVLMFLWVAVSQVAMLLLGWTYLRRGELVLWRKARPVQPSLPEPAGFVQTKPDEQEKANDSVGKAVEEEQETAAEQDRDPTPK